MNAQLIRPPAQGILITILTTLTLIFMFFTLFQSEINFSNPAPKPGKLKQPFFVESPHIETSQPTELGFIANDSQARNGHHYNGNVLFYSPIATGTFYVSQSGELYYKLYTNQTGQSKTTKKAKEFSFVIKETLVDALPISIKVNSTALQMTNISGESTSAPKKPPHTFKNVSMGDIYPGVELVLNARAKNVEKIFLISPHSNAAQIKIAISGIDNAEITTSGKLTIEKNGSEYYFTKPIAFQYIDNNRIDIGVDYVLEKNGELFYYSFDVGHYDKNVSLIIDPLLASTFLGGELSEEIHALLPDADNSFYIAGSTGSSDFPTTIDAYSTTNNGRNDGFISKLDNNLESVLQSSFIGGTGFDRILAAFLDSEGNVVVAGETYSDDFPVIVGAFDQTFNGVSDIFIAKLSPDLSTLLASTYLGGAAIEEIPSFYLDSTDNVIITGRTWSTDFPTSSTAYVTNFTPASQIFVSVISSDLTQLVASTFLGLTVTESVAAVEADSQGNIFILGTASQDSIPTTTATAYSGGGDAFIIKFNPGLTNIISATYFGGFGPETPQELMLEGLDNVYIAGTVRHSLYTDKTEFPATKGAYQTIMERKNQIDIFISKFDNNLGVLKASTLLGGIGSDMVQDIRINNDNTLYITGSTGSMDYPTSENAYNKHNVGSGDVIISRMTTDLTRLFESTRLGASMGESGYKIATDTLGNVFVAGQTSSEKFPLTTNAFDKEYISRTNNGLGTNEIFVSKLTNDLAGSRSISVSPESFEFTIPTENTTVVPQTIILTNIGTGYLKIVSISIENSNANFNVIDDNCGYTFDTIAPNENCYAVVSFRNVTPGTNSAILLITSDDTATPEIRATLTASNTPNSGGNGAGNTNGNSDTGGGGAFGWLFILSLLFIKVSANRGRIPLIRLPE